MLHMGAATGKLPGVARALVDAPPIMTGMWLFLSCNQSNGIREAGAG
jgi:hypothetical protein